MWQKKIISINKSMPFIREDTTFIYMGTSPKISEISITNYETGEYRIHLDMKSDDTVKELENHLMAAGFPLISHIDKLTCAASIRTSNKYALLQFLSATSIFTDLSEIMSELKNLLGMSASFSPVKTNWFISGDFNVCHKSYNHYINPRPGYCFSYTRHVTHYNLHLESAIKILKIKGFPDGVCWIEVGMQNDQFCQKLQADLKSQHFLSRILVPFDVPCCPDMLRVWLDHGERMEQLSKLINILTPYTHDLESIESVVKMQVASIKKTGVVMDQSYELGKFFNTESTTRFNNKTRIARLFENNAEANENEKDPGIPEITSFLKSLPAVFPGFEIESSKTCLSLFSNHNLSENTTTGVSLTDDMPELDNGEDESISLLS